MAAQVERAGQMIAPETAIDVLPPVGAPAVDFVVRNLGRGGIVEVSVCGTLDVGAIEELRGRLHTLASKRQPSTLRVDLAAANALADGTLDALLEAAAILDGFGSKLVICNAGSAFERLVPLDRLGRSLVIEGTPRNG